VRLNCNYGMKIRKEEKFRLILFWKPFRAVKIYNLSIQQAALEYKLSCIKIQNVMIIAKSPEYMTTNLGTYDN